MNSSKYYLGLDIGTDSVGYAVTDTSSSYKLLKYGGEPMWGVHLFEEAELCDKRRAARTARRRLDRRQQRVQFVQELFAKEIAKVDPSFYNRISESALLRSDSAEPYCLFNDTLFSDKDYHKKYPTIHHLICELMNESKPHDVRLVYIACAWMVAHRGHFLSDVSVENVAELQDLVPAYNDLLTYFREYPFEGDYSDPWILDGDGVSEFGRIIKQRGISKKKNDLCMLLFNNKKAPKTSDGFPFSIKCIIDLLCGSSGVSLAELFNNPEYDGFDKVSLASDDEGFENVLINLGDGGELLRKLKAVYDWSVLNDLLANKQYISESKVEIYNQHRKDLKLLKSIVKEYYDKDKYRQIFRLVEVGNYVSYSGKIKSSNDKYADFKKCKASDFNDYLKNVLEFKDENKKNRLPEEMVRRIQDGTFMPKQVNGDNRVIPYQLYYAELEKILKNASSYLSFLNEKDESGMSVSDKVLSVMRYRIPYYVGPLNKRNNEHAWIERKAEGKIYPWNFDEMVDLDKSEQMFIKRMTNSCTYLAGEKVLPKKSLLYEKFEVLNEINNIKIRDKVIPVPLKQALYTDLFMTRKKVSLSAIKTYLRLHNVSGDDVETISGIDKDIKSSLSSHISFDRLLKSGAVSYQDAEEIIRHKTFSEDNNRFQKWLKSKYQNVSEDDVKYIASLPLKEFGRLSEKLLCEIKGNLCDLKTGELLAEPKTIIELMWENNVNLSELILSDSYSFGNTINQVNKAYYSEKQMTLADRLDDLYVSNAVKRPIIRTLDVVRDVVKANGGAAPEKIFVEMARGTKENPKGQRTKTRKQQILELYEKIKTDDVRNLKKRLEEYGDNADNNLQSDKLFLYYMQLGKSMYSGEEINIEQLSSKAYDIDHIYPQSIVKDDSVLNNKVLVLSVENGAKGNTYPVDANIRATMRPFWESLLSKGLITEEKYRRLIRNTPFTEEEEWGFINRQLTETRQSTKVVAQLLQEKYPSSEIVYVKAGLVSDFRHDYDIPKSRSINDLHHAKDAYLNIVCGNVFHSKFTKKWFLSNWKSSQYTVSSKSLFEHNQTIDGVCVWDGNKSIAQIKSTVWKNNCHQTYYSIIKKHGQNGGLFDQNPLKAVNSPSVPRKSNLDVEKYGGYDKQTTSFVFLVKYKIGKQYKIEFVPVVLIEAAKVLKEKSYAIQYIKNRLDSKAEEISLLLDGRPIKLGTILEIDGLRVLLGSQKSKSDTRLGIKVFTPLILPPEQNEYLKSIESFNKKIGRNDALMYSEEYDKVNAYGNLAIYDTIIDKFQKTVYKNRPEIQVKKIIEKRKQFIDCDVKSQCSVLLNLISHFNRTALSDKLISTSSDCRLVANLSQWKYEDVRIIDASTSGIWETKSQNLKTL